MSKFTRTMYKLYGVELVVIAVCNCVYAPTLELVWNQKVIGASTSIWVLVLGLYLVGLGWEHEELAAAGRFLWVCTSTELVVVGVVCLGAEVPAQENWISQMYPLTWKWLEMEMSAQASVVLGLVTLGWLGLRERKREK